jgi:hypothetical protein
VDFGLGMAVSQVGLPETEGLLFQHYLVLMDS